MGLIDTIALGAFIFVTLAVAGWRALDLLAERERAEDRERVEWPKRRANVSVYRGPLYSDRGRETD